MNSIKTHWHSSFHGFKKGSQTSWTITLSTRGTIIGKLLGMAGLSNLEEASQESKPYRIIRDTRDVEEVITALRSTMNPFNAEGTDNAKLYHLTSGRAASNDMKDDQINVVSIRVLHGQTNFGKSEQKIQPGKKRFAKPIKRRKIKNFTTDAKKINIHRKDLTVKEVLCTRDIWGCLVYLAAVQNLELEHVMSSYGNGSSTTCSY